VAGIDSLWLPEGAHWDLNIEHHPLRGGTGPMTGGGWKMPLHTTESPREWIDGAIKQFTAGSGTPHLSIGWRKGLRFPVVAQFLPFNQYAKTLEHPTGTPETNKANAVQIEICGTAARSKVDVGAPNWEDNWYKALANVLLLTQHRVGFPIRRPRPFLVPIRFTGSGWIKAKGIVGHCHAPNNSHSDPGRIKAGKLLRYMKAGRQELRPR
jgi:hypothetical protein